MRVLFTADIHVKLGQKSVPVDWAKNRYNLLWADLKELQSQCDMFIVGGDVFDKVLEKGCLSIEEAFKVYI